AVIGVVATVLVTTVVVRLTPSHCTALTPGTKPVPSTVSVNAGFPNATPAGLSDVTVGTGFCTATVKLGLVASFVNPLLLNSRNSNVPRNGGVTVTVLLVTGPTYVKL